MQISQKQHPRRQFGKQVQWNFNIVDFTKPVFGEASTAARYTYLFCLASGEEFIQYEATGGTNGQDCLALIPHAACDHAQARERDRYSERSQQQGTQTETNFRNKHCCRTYQAAVCSVEFEPTGYSWNEIRQH